MPICILKASGQDWYNAIFQLVEKADGTYYLAQENTLSKGTYRTREYPLPEENCVVYLLIIDECPSQSQSTYPWFSMKQFMAKVNEAQAINGSIIHSIEYKVLREAIAHFQRNPFAS